MLLQRGQELALAQELPAGEGLLCGKGPLP